jgi:isopropylmalate/homocitrate/citramalate synthase
MITQKMKDWRVIASEDMRFNLEAEQIFVQSEMNRTEVVSRQEIDIVEVTLRDGLQQDDINKGIMQANGKYEGLSVEDRLAIFDMLVDSGIETIEVGHFGNPEDRPFGAALVEHIQNKSALDERYKKVKIQVLFGTQSDGILEGIKTLGDFDKERVIVHIYTRISAGLQEFASLQPNTPKKAFEDMAAASDLIISAGFKHLSISGEGAVDHWRNPETVIKFYQDVIRYLFTLGATSVNANLANTFGEPEEGDWDESGLREFDTDVKSVANEFEEPKIVTTSVHTHNDYQSAVSYSIAALKAGFDKVEGAFIGMGERTGNTALVDLYARLIQTAYTNYEKVEQMLREGQDIPEDVFTVRALQNSIFRKRQLPSRIAEAFSGNFERGRKIGEIAGTRRFGRTILGNAYAYHAGSGPHQEANAKYAMDPIFFPLLETYGRIMLVNAIQGAPAACGVVDVNMSAIQAITALNHASGGNGARIHSGHVQRANNEQVEAHRAIVDSRLQTIRGIMSGIAENDAVNAAHV